jgi:soluble lytic murein transglycosylase-like protein
MRFRADIERFALMHSLDPDVVQAVVEKESSGRWYAVRYEPLFWTTYLANNPEYRDRDPREVSSSYGLMQIMFTTAVENGFSGQPWDLFRPEVNLDLGCRHLARLIGKMRGLYKGLSAGAEGKILRSALASYNGGMRGNAPDDLPDRNRVYAEDVLARAAIIRQRNGG